MSDCYCTLDDRPSVYWETNPKARKKHICCECGSEISPGEKYHKFTGIWDGELNSFKTCSICESIKVEVLAEDVECITFGCLWETVGNEFEYAAT